MKNIIPLTVFLILFVPVIKSHATESNQFKEHPDTYSQEKLSELSNEVFVLKDDCECIAWGNYRQYHKDSILVDSCAAVYDDMVIDSCQGNLYLRIGISIDEASFCRTEPIFNKEDSIFCDRWFEMEKTIRIKSINFDSARAGVEFLLKKDYFPKKFPSIITKEDVYPEYPEFKKYLTNLENEFDIFPKYRGSNNNITFYFKDFVNLHDFLEVAFNQNYVDNLYLNFFLITTAIENEVNDSKIKTYYSNGNIEINSNSEYLKSFEIYDLYGNKINSISSINTLSYNININLNTGVYFLLINESQIIKLSITE